jgi:hypothetical protein
LTGTIHDTHGVTNWCPTCGTEHPLETVCRRQVEATGPERPQWRVSVISPQGVRGYGVLVAEAGQLWRARIVTFPNILWMIPGGGETLKFLSKSEERVTRKAIDFIRQHCVAKGYLMRDEVQFVRPLKRSFVVAGSRVAAQRFPRFDRRLPIRFGHNRPTILGRTVNLSESGLFIETGKPTHDGEQLGLMLELEHCKVPLRGSVAWRRTERHSGLDCGMGLRLVSPPSNYVDYVRALG